MWKIKKSVILDAIQAAQNYLPREFLCFLSAELKTKTINEVVLLATINSQDAVSFLSSSVPIDATIVGTLHSHPYSAGEPSAGDRKTFSKYDINIILGYPYSIQNAGFFDSNGKKAAVLLID